MSTTEITLRITVDEAVAILEWQQKAAVFATVVDRRQELRAKLLQQLQEQAATAASGVLFVLEGIV